jgi:hypothetical protein
MSESNHTMMLTSNLKALIWGLLTTDHFEDEQDCGACKKSLTKKTLHITQCGCLFHKACWEKEEETRKKNFVGVNAPCSRCPRKYDIYKWNAGEVEEEEAENYSKKMMKAMIDEGSIASLPEEESESESEQCECGGWKSEGCMDDCPHNKSEDEDE